MSDLPPPFPARLWRDFAGMTRFYSRLPVPVFAFERDPHGIPDFAGGIWAVPVVGAILGTIAGSVAWGAMILGLSPLIAAVLAIFALVLFTGCFHEDGLADSTDGFWGGMTIERRLEIMKDSRIGSYGAAALVLSIALRIACLAEIFRLMGPQGAWLIIGIASLTRAMALVPAWLLPLARENGIAKAAPKPTFGGVLLALVIGMVFYLVPARDLPIMALPALLPSILGLGLAIAVMRAKISGYTGDALGASQQVSEMALLLGLTALIARSGPY